MCSPILCDAILNIRHRGSVLLDGTMSVVSQALLNEGSIHACIFKSPPSIDWSLFQLNSLYGMGSRCAKAHDGGHCRWNARIFKHADMCHG